MREFQGVFPATLTPFRTPTGSVDTGWINEHMRFLMQQGMTGVLALGTTGEGPSLSVDERKQVIDTVLTQRGEMTVMIGTGCASLPETIALSRYAMASGADALLVAPPFFFKDVPDSGLLTYFRALCDALPESARVLLYHIPQVTTVPITLPVVQGLLESHPRQFFGIKDSSGDLATFAAFAQYTRELYLYGGNERIAAETLAHGARGLISAIANLFPDAVQAVYLAHRNGGDVAAAQQHLRALSDAFTGNTPPALKAAMPWYTSLPRTSVRVPLSDLHDKEGERLRQQLHTLRATATSPTLPETS